MRNVINERPPRPDQLFGRLGYAAQFVDEADVLAKSVLDIGCGYGWFELFSFTKGVRRIIGIEPTSSDLATAKAYVDDARADFLIGSAVDLPFRDSSVDTVVCWEVLEHLTKGQEIQYFKEVRRVLRSGGQFYLSTPYSSTASSILDPARWLVAHRHYPEHLLRSMAGAAGLEIERIGPAGGWWEILSWWNIYISKWLLRRKPLLARHMRRALDTEYQSRPGFAILFCKMIAR